MAVDHLAVARRVGLHVHDDELVRALTESLDAEGPDIDEFLLTFDACKVGRRAGFVGARVRNELEAHQRECGEDDASPGEPGSTASNICFHRDILASCYEVIHMTSEYSECNQQLPTRSPIHSRFSAPIIQPIRGS